VSTDFPTLRREVFRVHQTRARCVGRNPYKWNQKVNYRKSLVAVIGFAASVITAEAQMPVNAAFYQMLSDTGCKSRFSDEKKADLFATQYRGRSMTVSGEITSLRNGSIGVKALSGTLTSDIDVKLRDVGAAYDLEKGQRITVSFTVSFHGGCFLSYSGDNGVIVK
jgi:hypothetical protein